ncbi:MAG: tetratricopeptide repeat protein [bacterium]
MRIPIVLLIAGGLLAVTTPVTNAEETPKVRIIESKIAPHFVDSETEPKIRLAQKLIQARGFDAAAALLEEVYEQHPGSARVTNLLLTCYIHLGQLPRAEDLCHRMIDQDPLSCVHWLRLAEMLVKQARPDEAVAAYDSAVALIENNDRPRYQTALRSMITNGFEEKALDLIDTARIRMNEPFLFALERGEILENRSDFQLAAMEFIACLQDSGRIANDAEKRLLALLSYPSASAEVEQSLLQRIGDRINPRAAGILSAHYLKAGQYDRAFDFAIAQDSQENGRGVPILNYIRRCHEQRLYRQVIRMAEYILGSSQDLPLREQAYYMLGDALIQTGHPDQAISIYDSLFAGGLRPREKAEALYHIGAIYLNHLQDYQRALIFFDSIATHYPAGTGGLNALLAQPYCYLRQGLLNEARSRFTDLLKRQLPENSLEAVEYNLALILFFQQQFDSSKTAMRKLMVEYPRGYYVNDALQILVLLQQSEDAPGLLPMISKAILFQEMSRPDSSVAVLLAVAEDSNRTLADVALFKLAGLSLDQSDSVAAIGFVDRLNDEFPLSYYLPYGLKIKADIFLNRPEDVPSARSIYRRLLQDFPDYPFISDVRKTMRRLEGDA